MLHSPFWIKIDLVSKDFFCAIAFLHKQLKNFMHLSLTRVVVYTVVTTLRSVFFKVFVTVMRQRYARTDVMVESVFTVELTVLEFRCALCHLDISI